MNRKEKIFQYLSEYARIQTDSGFEPEADSGYIAERLGLDRSNVSRDLNELAREGLTVKLDGRPVKFVPAEFYRKPEPEKRESKEFAFDGINSSAL